MRSGVQTPLFSVQHVPGHELNGAAATAEKIPKTIFIFFFSILRVRKVWWNIFGWGVFKWQKAPEAGRSGVDCLERFQINCSQGWKFDLNKNLDFWIDHQDRTKLKIYDFLKIWTMKKPFKSSWSTMSCEFLLLSLGRTMKKSVLCLKIKILEMIDFY